jgi:hypothetical protein
LKLTGGCVHHQQEYKKIMKKCWHNKPEKRPKMEDVVTFFDSLIGEDNDRDQP